MCGARWSESVSGGLGSAREHDHKRGGSVAGASQGTLPRSALGAHQKLTTSARIKLTTSKTPIAAWHGTASVGSSAPPQAHKSFNGDRGGVLIRAARPRATRPHSARIARNLAPTGGQLLVSRGGSFLASAEERGRGSSPTTAPSLSPRISKRPGVPLSLADAKRLVEQYVSVYNEQRRHTGIGYVTPRDRLAGHQAEMHAERDRKLEQVRRQREAEERAELPGRSRSILPSRDAAA